MVDCYICERPGYTNCKVCQRTICKIHAEDIVDTEYRPTAICTSCKRKRKLKIIRIISIVSVILLIGIIMVFVLLSL